MAIKLTDIESLVARFGNKVVTEQANLETPFVGKGTISKMNHTGTVGIVNVKSGGLTATAFIEDAGTLPTGDSKKPVQLAYHPKALFSRLTVPRISALTAISKQDGVNIVKEQMETVGADLGRTLGRALFSSSLDGSAGNDVITGGNTVALGAVSSDVDTTGYRVGMIVEGLIDNADAADLFGKVTAVADGATVTMELYTDANASTARTVKGGAGAELLDGPACSPKLRGSGTTGNSIVSILDLADSTVAEGTITETGNYSGASASTTPGWKGSETTGGTLGLGDLEDQSTKTKRQSGRPWDVLVMNSTNLGRYATLLTGSNIQFQVQGSGGADGSPSSLTFQGKPIIVDENMPDGDILFFTKADTKLAVWRDFKPDSDGKGASMVDSTSLTYDTQIFGLFNVRCSNRNGLGKVNAITG